MKYFRICFQNPLTFKGKSDFFELKIFCYYSENENDCKIWSSSIKA